MVDGGIDMWGSRRVPPLQNMWMVEDTHPDEDMGETPLVPSEDARMTAQVPPDGACHSNSNSRANTAAVHITFRRVRIIAQRKDRCLQARRPR